VITSNAKSNNDPYIIAIGASAGGMEAIHLLFDNTPEDGVSYVIIQNLSRDHKSFMAELLAKHSKLQICEVKNGMHIENNQVYLMPGGKNMTIRDRKLYLSVSTAGQPNSAIDIFFDSLAEDQGAKSIAIILSGTGSDGTKGISAIKNNGGYVIVQNPESAKFDGMPRNAIESGNADVILPPELIPEEIFAYLKRNQLEINFSTEFSEIEESLLLEILNLIHEFTPLDFTNYKRPTIIRRVVNRMARNRMNSLPEYIDFLKSNHDEIEILSKEFLISVTKFFRDPLAFEIIKEKVIPEIIHSKLQVDTLKVWVVGCATGEEAYSIAILIVEYLTELKKNLEVKIFASDIDKSALHIASRGLYPESIAHEVSEERLFKFFSKEDTHYKVRDNIRKMIIFADHDIVKQPPYGKIDLITCRNLLIYINPLLQKKILNALHFCLNMGGYLFLGPSESLSDLKKSFTEIDKKWKIFKSAESISNSGTTIYSTPGLEKQWNLPPRGTSIQKNILKKNLSEIILVSMMQESGYKAGICINEDLMIIQTFGNCEQYLLPKIFNFDLLEMLPEELSIAVSTSIRKALKENRKVVVNNINFSRNELIHSVDILIKPCYNDAKSEHNITLILLNDKKVEDSAIKHAEEFNLEKYTLQYLEDLRSENTEIKQKLRDMQDALELANDNLSSYNEELISGNEEMQSTNEELQSVNEELQTVNNEYQLKIKELAELNDDLNNYFRGSIHGQLYVDKNFVVRKFTPSAVKQINLKESDIGRILSDISTNIKFSTLMDDIQKVILRAISTEKEVQTLDGRWYQMMIIPYLKLHHNTNEGAIITFSDITELKKVQTRLSKVNADHDTFIYAASHDLLGPLNNMEYLFGLYKEKVKPSDDDVALAEMMQTSIAQLRSTISELSDIARIESEIDAQENIDLKILLDEVTSSIKDLILKSKAEIVSDIQATHIPFSKKNLRSIIFNILTNAIKYKSPDRNPEISIKSEMVDEYFILSIADNGLGLDASMIHDIFTKFRRKHNHVEGSGIGLFLAKKIITNAGGEIEVESEVGKGSVFKVYFKN
jgi:two-component system CheB/CheR fusion protein